MTNLSRIQTPSSSLLVGSHINYLLLEIWFQRFARKKLSLSLLPFTLGCEIIGSPVLEEVTVEPIVDPLISETTFCWMSKKSQNKHTSDDLFSLKLDLSDFDKNVSILSYSTPSYQIGLDQCLKNEIEPVQRKLNDLFQTFLGSFIEVDFY